MPSRKSPMYPVLGTVIIGIVGALILTGLASIFVGVLYKRREKSRPGD
jgi:hypothetical protein